MLRNFQFVWAPTAYQKGKKKKKKRWVTKKKGYDEMTYQMFQMFHGNQQNNIIGELENSSRCRSIHSRCVVEGFDLDNKNRAWLLPWSQTMYLGSTGNRSTSRSWASATGTSSNSLKFSYPLSWYPWFCRWATSSPWKMRMWKNVSRRRTTSCLMETLSRRTGIGGVSKV